VSGVNFGGSLAAPSVRNRRRGIAGKAAAWLSQNWIGILSAAILIAAWEIVGIVADYPYLPPVSKILAALWQLLLNGTILRALSTTLLALFIGLATAIVLGITVGTAMGLSATARFALGPYVDALMSAPMTAFVPLFILLFGLGIETRVVVVILFAFFPIVVNTQAGMMAAREDLIEMARSFGATPRKIFFKVRLPMSYDHIRAGLRMSMARGVEGNITGEVLIAAVGLGGLVTQYGRAFTADRLFAVVIVIVCMSFAAGWLTDLASRLLVGLRK
jgi:NitT/TauT family transport system permease protein